MKQILENMKTGEIELADVPCPKPGPGQLLIRTTRSLVSAGTERMLLEFGKASLIDKARQQPDRVRQVLDKVRTDGLLPALDAVWSKLDTPIPLGYSNAGLVLEVGAGVTGFAVGDRVVSNGPHAEAVRVAKNLCAKVPDGVSDDEAACAVIGAIALEGIRLARPTLGEAFVVTGLGLIGLVTVELLRAHGCRVLGVDMDPARLRLAERFGAHVVDLSRGDDPVATAAAFSRGRGVDGVIITASTKESGPVHEAAQMCRKRGRIVLVGVVGLELSRADFYAKELSFQVSCSYGPGRYDPEYEERGHDYPFGFVRWTEQRNLEAVLDMMAGGRIDVAPLISHRFPFDRALGAYELLGSKEPSLGILLEYPREADTTTEALRVATVPLGAAPAAGARGGSPVVGWIGAGNYATRVLMPAFRDAGARLKVVASSGGASGVHAGRKFGFEVAASDAAAAIEDPEITTVVITTRHDSHAKLVCRALEAGKHVFVEKPLALSSDEVDEIESVTARLPQPTLLMVGFNRRFAPQVQKIASLLAGAAEPAAFIMTVNAGAIPPDHWTQDPGVGGGRIIGEACHFVDLLRFLAGAPIVSLQARAMGDAAGALIRDDKVSFTLGFANGSFGTVHYLANGSTAFPKERLDVFCAGRVLELDNFRRLRGYGWRAFKKMNLFRQDKGQTACARAFVEAVKAGGVSPIPFAEILEVSRATIGVAEAVRGGATL
jgi:predicted dehydrogenase/threonine dehydrogenase-like Zn-dependent dehydrogenase